MGPYILRLGSTSSNSRRKESDSTINSSSILSMITSARAAVIFSALLSGHARCLMNAIIVGTESLVSVSTTDGCFCGDDHACC